jgi:N-terminal 7TM region of histidine kinase
MVWQFTTYTFLALASAVVSSALALTAWYRRPAPGAGPFCLLMLSMTVWSPGYALKLAGPNMQSALVLNNVAVLGAICAPPLWLIFTLHYSGRTEWLARQNLALLLIEPWLVDGLTTSGFNPFPSLHLTPLILLISSLTFAQSLILFRLLDIVPVAREMVIESMREATMISIRRRGNSSTSKLQKGLDDRSRKSSPGGPNWWNAAIHW